MNILALIINHKMLFVINIAKVMMATTVYKNYKCSDIIKDNMCILAHYILMTYINILTNIGIIRG